MPDYSTIIKRSVDSVPDHTPEMRRAIYDRARATIAKQLANVEPPLSAEQIEKQKEQLEQAIAEIEVEYSFEGFDPAEFEAEIGLHVREQIAESEAEPDELDEPEEEIDRADDEPEEVVPKPRPAASIDFGTEPTDFAASGGSVRVKKSNAPTFIILSLLLLAVIGAGVLGYRYQDQIMAMLDSGDDTGTQVADVSATDAPAAPDEMTSEPVAPDSESSGIIVTKNEERIGTPENDQSDEGVEVLRGSGTEDDLQPGEAEQSAALTNNPARPVAPSAGQSEPTVTGAAGVSGGETDRVGTGSQRAIFYTQGEDNQPGQASQGVVMWDRVEQPDGLPAIQARIGLDNPKVDVTVTISRNTDQQLPASHLIEVSFDGVKNMTGAALERIPGIVLKPNEQARGQPLAGAGVPVTDEIFWIALSDEAEQSKNNIEKLREGTWFDMPLLFKDQQRALITFEKGGAGELLFKEVFAAWDAS